MRIEEEGIFIVDKFQRPKLPAYLNSVVLLGHSSDIILYCFCHYRLLFAGRSVRKFLSGTYKVFLKGETKESRVCKEQEEAAKGSGSSGKEFEIVAGDRQRRLQLAQEKGQRVLITDRNSRLSPYSFNCQR